MDTLEQFKKEVQAMSTADIILILKDQQDLYSAEEIEILKTELNSRSSNTTDLENEVNDYIEKEKELEQQQKDNMAYYLKIQREQEQREAAQQRRQEWENEERKKQQEQAEAEKKKQQQYVASKLNDLQANGYDGYWEYKVVSLNDNNEGNIYTSGIETVLNNYALDGWHLKAAYTNELGKNSHSIGIIGVSTGTNSTIDQHIFILERFIRF